ncbi:hypothetical protein K3495_g12363 [Podosphaera aphanis]|nr:hypothetical protein K3495_g12363 [Podosphaera aphanis]
MANRFMVTDNDLYANKGQKVLVIVTVFPILALIALILRLYTRIKIIRNPALDDWFSTIAVIFSIASSISINLQVQYGMGRHIETLTHSQAMKYYKSLYSFILIYSSGYHFTKLSILLQYLRIATKRKTRLVCHTMVFFNIILGLEIFVTAIFHCWPIARFWDNDVNGKCIDTTVLWLFNTSLNIAGDLILLALPIFILNASNLPRRRKISLWMVLSSGSFAAIISVWRLYFLYIVLVSEDITWDNPGISIWACIELNTSIFCSCVSTLKPLTSQFIPLIFRTVSSNSEEQQMGNIAAQNNLTGIGPLNLQGHKIDIVIPSERSPLHETGNGPIMNPNIPENRETTTAEKGLVLTQLPNYPALVIVSTKT